MQATHIRPASPGDQAVLAGLCASVQDLHFHERPDVFKPVDHAALEVWFAETLGETLVHIWIAQIGQEPVGYALVREQQRSETAFCYRRDSYEVDQISVHPAYRRRGVATALLRHISEFAKAAGVTELELNTWAFNESAHLAFEKVGFTLRNMRFCWVVG